MGVILLSVEGSCVFTRHRIESLSGNYVKEHVIRKGKWVVITWRYRKSWVWRTRNPWMYGYVIAWFSWLYQALLLRIPHPWMCDYVIARFSWLYQVLLLRIPHPRMCDYVIGIAEWWVWIGASLIFASQRDFNCRSLTDGRSSYISGLQNWRKYLPCLWCKRGSGCVIWGFRRHVYEVFILLGCYAAFIGSYRRLGTTYRSHLQRSGLLSALRWNKYLVPKCRWVVWKMGYRFSLRQ